MAWQLIYTSAPRLLEAGHSGFGTVARHRQMSPLLVSAVERMSQFARQPGLDPHRVVFAHRIVTVAGGRFHVLSCIRDAGADYTGRTNHIAHHLIAEPREIAQLSAGGASPADILMVMPWRTAWAEIPRHLEAADEIALDRFVPQTKADGRHWAGVTGSAAHAWLLAHGEASRGAYLVVPEGTDVRPLFAESLRLMPERAWQNGFITSLQPSDDPSDFRWIALEASSPLRPQAESSGRPVLDLTAPDTLPAGEVPRPTRGGVPVAELMSEDAAPRTAAFGAPGLRREIDPFQNFKPTRRTPWKGIGAGVAAALLAAGAAAYFALHAAGERQLFESEIDRVLGSESAEYFSEKTKSELKDVGSDLRPTALDLAGASRDLFRAKKSATGEARESALARATAAGSRLQAQGRNVPAQISDLARQVGEAVATARAAPVPVKNPKEKETPVKPVEPVASKPPAAAENKPASEAKPAPVKPLTPVYFVNGLTAMEKLPCEELGKGLTYFLRSPVLAEPARLVGPTAQGGLRRNVTESPVFTVDETARHISVLRGNGAPSPPFVILARDAADREVVQLWVVAEAPAPLLPRRTAGLARMGNALVLDAAKLGFPGTPKTPLRLFLPDEYGIPGTKNEALAVSDWKADLAPRQAEIEKRREAAGAEIKRLEAALAAKPVAEPSAEFREKKKFIGTIITRDIDAWMDKAERDNAREHKGNDKALKEQHDLNAKKKKEKMAAAEMNLKDSKTLMQEFGSCIVAFCVDADIQELVNLSTLGNLGAELRAMNEKAEVKDEVALLTKTQNKILDMLGQISGFPDKKAKYEPALKTMEAMIRMITPENPEMIVRRMREQEQRATELKAKREELRLLAAHPLLAAHSPPVIVARLMVVAGGAEIGLMEIEFAW